MSTVISMKNDNSHKVTQVTKESELGWSLLASAMGYPESWTSIVKARLTREGKSWDWRLTNAAAGSELLQTSQEASGRTLQEGGQVVLVMNSNTAMKDARNALSLAKRTNAKISVIYTSKPPLSDNFTPGEVDQKFTLELERGRSTLAAIAAEARSLGVKANTSFIWADSSKELVRKHKLPADLVIDETS